MGSSDDAATTTTALKKKGVFGYEGPEVSPIITPEATSLTGSLFGGSPAAAPATQPLVTQTPLTQPLGAPQVTPEQNIMASLGLPPQASPQAVAAQAVAPGLQNNPGLNQTNSFLKRLRGNQNVVQG